MQVDSDFPQLQEIVDEQKLVKTLQRHMGDSFSTGEMQVEACRKSRIYYKSGNNCRMRFTAIFRNCHSQQVSEQVFFGQLFRGKPKRFLRENIDPKRLTQPKFGPSVMYIPEWAMVLWAYPNDPELPGLSHLVKAEKVLARMKADPARFNLQHSPVSITGNVTKYVPGKRCGYVYHITNAGTDSSRMDVNRAVYGKAYQGKDGETAYSILTQISKTNACKNGKILFSQPYSYDSENKIMWQEALHSPSLAKVVGGLSNLPEIGEEIGWRLAAFHGTDLNFPKEMTIDYQIKDLRTKSSAICSEFPEHRVLCEKVVQGLFTQSSKLESVVLRPVHASFKLSHIFAEEKGITFIDFDGANLGDPGYDLGRFIAHLYRMTLSGKIQSGIAEQTVNRFCESYNREARHPLSQERINWFAASHLVCSEVYKIVKRVGPNNVREILIAAERLSRGYIGRN